MTALVTGAYGFIGRNLVTRLKERGDEVLPIGSKDSIDTLRAGLIKADVVYHLAGVNRPEDPDDFSVVNVEYTRTICDILRDSGRTPTIVFSSSIQALNSNPYGLSKWHAEIILRSFEQETGACVRIHRLPNVFGKWCRPNYNSVVATFCYNIANDLPIQISDDDRVIELVYIDDVTNSLMGSTTSTPVTKVTLGNLAKLVRSLKQSLTDVKLPYFSARFTRQLYATYLSYMPSQERIQQLDVKMDQRGSLAEFIKSDAAGQLFVSRTKPGITRGDHYHHTKAEKFLVVEGRAVVRMRRIDDQTVFTYPICGEKFRVVNIPPGFTHSIENVGAGELVTLFWASEVFDPANPDTHYLKVIE